jgi:hypothetical protein
MSKKINGYEIDLGETREEAVPSYFKVLTQNSAEEQKIHRN